MVNNMKTLKINHSKNNKYYIGVDVGGTAIKFGIFKDSVKKAIGSSAKCSKKVLQTKEASNKILVDKFSSNTIIVQKDNEKHLLKFIFDEIENYIKNNKYGVTKNKIVGIGFAMPGPVVNNQLIHAVNINWKKKYDIVSATKKRFGQNIKVLVYNDGNAATLGENSYTLKNKYKSMCLITLGTAVGTGIIINGNLIEGHTGIAGELSHIRIDYTKDAKKCACGNVGCVETLSGTKGLKNIYKRLLGEKKWDDTIDAKTIIDRAKAKDKIAYEAVDLSFDSISTLITILMHVFEPEVVLIGGGISNAGTFVTDIIREHLKEKIFMTKRLPKLMISKLKNDAGIYGVVSKL